MSIASFRPAIVLSLLLSLGCGSPPEQDAAQATQELRAPPSCEGLAAEECLLPWPSSRFLVRDRSTATGWRVELPAGGMPANVFGSPVDPGPWNRWDGFSPMTSIIAQLPVRIDPSSLVDYRHVARSLGASSPTILFDATIGQRVAHWAEIEAAADADPTRTTIYLRPAARLAENHRFVVIIRRLRAVDGSWFEGNRGRREALSEDDLERSGVGGHSIALAWDFRTASGSSAWGDLLAMRNDAVALTGASGLGCQVTNAVEDPSDPHVFRLVEGTITVPRYLDPSGLLARDGTGRPQRTGTEEIAFTLVIPRSVAAGGPARLVTFGHGLMSDRSEVLTDFLRQQANDYPMVLVATNLSGLAAGDEESVGMSLFDVNGFNFVMDRVAQSIIGTLLLPRTIAGACSALPALQVNGRPVVDGARRYYYGISQGGNFGPTFAALSDDMDRFVMSVGGINYPVMITRSVHWPALSAVLEAGYPSRIQRDLLMVMFAAQWERVEGSAFAPHVLRDPLVGGPKRVLAQVGLYDAQTPNEGSHVAARTMGLPQAIDDASPVFGLRTYSGAAPSAYVTFDLGAQVIAPSTLPPSADNGVHEAVRRDPRAQAQIDTFLRPTGVVVR